MLFTVGLQLTLTATLPISPLNFFNRYFFALVPQMAREYSTSFTPKQFICSSSPIASTPSSSKSSSSPPSSLPKIFNGFSYTQKKRSRQEYEATILEKAQESILLELSCKRNKQSTRATRKSTTFVPRPLLLGNMPPSPPPTPEIGCISLGQESITPSIPIPNTITITIPKLEIITTTIIKPKQNKNTYRYENHRWSRDEELKAMQEYYGF